MTTTLRAFRGTVIGLLWAFLALPAALPFSHYCEGLDFVVMGIGLALLMSPFLVVLFGPGAYLLSLIHAFWMERWAEHARTRSGIRIVGVLLGMPLGLINLMATFFIMAHFNGSLGNLTVTRDLLVVVIPALAGGAGLGWGITGKLLPQRPLTRPRPAIRRVRRVA